MDKLNLKRKVLSEKYTDMTKKLVEVCEIFSGGTPATKNESYWNGNIPWLSSGETRNSFIVDTERKITLEGVRNSSTKLAKKYDIVIASAGQGNTRGQVSLCLIDTYVNQSVIVLQTNTEFILPKFLFYNLKSRYEELRRISDSHSSRGSLPKNVISTINIPLPPLHDQEKIGKILYDFDCKIENLKNQNKILEQSIQTIFKSWFVDFDGQTEFVNSELGKIPKGWKISTIGYLCEKSGNGATPRRNIREYWDGGDIPWIKTGELSNGPILDSEEKITKQGLANSSCKIWDKGTILVAMYGATAGKLGYVTKSSTFNQACNAISAKEEYGNMFLFYVLKLHQKILFDSAIGAAQQNLNKDLIANQKIILPSSLLCTSFQRLVLPMFSQIIQNKTQAHSLKRIRDLILSKLMSGEIKIK